mmetsp:Transcript_9047/g.14300  ORF Transcript_9047/g.14300 Transcript_9047/m.14300 type:complete len:226 (+) Transcript_9047:790-1467(+)
MTDDGLRSCNRSHEFNYHPKSVHSKHGLGPIVGHGQLFANVIAPFTRMTLRAFLWYQGESNSHDPKAYECLFPEMIRNWRQAWGDNAIPFGFVHLSSDVNLEGLLPSIRRAQLAGVDVPNVFTVPSFDLGDPKSDSGPIHPRFKKQIGQRLARAAWQHVYRRATLETPQLQHVSIGATSAESLWSMPVKSAAIYEGESILAPDDKSTSAQSTALSENFRVAQQNP